MNQNLLRDKAPAFVLASLVVVAGVLANQNFRYVDVAGDSVGSPAFFPAVTSPKTNFEMAGYPLTYRSTINRKVASSSFNAGATSVPQPAGDAVMSDDGEWLAVKRSFSVLALLGNIVLWFGLAGVVIWLVGMVQRLKQDHHSFAAKWADGLVAIAILAIPISFIGFHSVRLHFQNAKIARINQSGAVYVSTWLPRILVGQLPSRLEIHLRRIRAVSVRDPDPKIVAEIASLPDLVSLALYGDAPVDAFVRGSSQPFLTNVSIYRTRMASSYAKFFDANPQILELELAGFALDEPTAQSISRMPQLRRLECRYGRMPLKSIVNPSWSDTVERLMLTVGYRNDEVLDIDSWSGLKGLRLEQTQARRSGKETRLRVSNCPELASVNLDVLRLFDVDLENNPRMVEFEPYISSEQINSHLIYFTTTMQLSGLRIKSCNSLGRLNLSVLPLKTFQVEDCAHLHVVDVSSIENLRYRSVSRVTSDIDLVETILRQLGRLSELRTLTLEGLPLADCEFVKPGEFAELRSLSLQNESLSQQQISDLTALDKLEKLKLGSVQVGNAETEILFNRLPKLESLTFDGRKLSRLSIDSTSSVTNFATSVLPELESLSVHAPNLNSGFHIGTKLKSISIKDSPRLATLVIDSPLPKKSTLEGFRDLKTIMVGGSEVGDSIVDAIGSCEGLERLMLAYGNLSANALRRIGEFTNLRSLSVPGNQVDDEIIRSWSKLHELWNLDLSHNPVGAAAVGWASRNASLRYLNLDNTNLPSEVVSMLAECEQVTHLSLVEVPVTPQQLERIISFCNLEYLNLSGSKLTDEHLDVLANAENPIPRLVLRRCQLTRQQFEDYVARQPKGEIDVGRMFSARQVVRLMRAQDPLSERVIFNGVINSFHQSQRDRGFARQALMIDNVGYSPKVSLRSQANMRKEQVDSAKAAALPTEENLVTGIQPLDEREGPILASDDSETRSSADARLDEWIDGSISYPGDSAWGDASKFLPDQLRPSDDSPLSNANEMASDFDVPRSGEDAPPAQIAPQAEKTGEREMEHDGAR